MKTYLSVLGLLLSLFLGACGGGGGGGGDDTKSQDNPSSLEISVNPGSVSVSLFKSPIYNPVNRVISGSFKGDGVIVGFAPGVSQPSWLNVPVSQLESPDGNFGLDIAIKPEQLSVGVYTTSLRFVTGHVDTEEYKYVDMPISVEIKEAPSVYTGDIHFLSSNSSTLLPESTSVTLNFSPYSNVTFSTTPVDTNSDASTWLSSNEIGQNTLNVAVSTLKPTGEYEGGVQINYQVGQSSGIAILPVKLSVVTAAPQISYVVPSVLYENEESKAYIRGHGFDLSNIESINFGGQQIIEFSVTNEAEIVVSLPGVSGVGVKHIEVKFVNAESPLVHELEVVNRPIAIGGVVEMGEVIRHVRYRMVDNSIIAAGDAHLFRLELVDGSWEIVSQRNIDATFGFDLTPDQNEVAYIDGQYVRLINANTLGDTRSYKLPDNIFNRISSFNTGVWEVMAGGEILFTADKLYSFELANQVVTESGIGSPPSVRDSDEWGTCAFFSPMSWDVQFRGFYFSSSRRFVARSAPVPSIAGNNYSMSGNGERLLLANSIFDQNLNLLGTLNFGSLGNFSQEMSYDGKTAYAVSAGSGHIRSYDVSTPPPYGVASDIYFPPYSYYAAGPSVLVTPDDGMMVLNGGSKGGSGNGFETFLTIVALK